MGRLFCYTLSARAIGATVSAGALHAQGWGFESLIAHHLIEKAPSDGGLSFLGPSQRDSNPQGCGAEETHKRFPAQHARAAGPKRKRAAPAARGHPSSPTTELLGLQRWRPFLFRAHRRGIRTLRLARFKGNGQKMPNMSTATFFVTAFSRSQRANLTSKQRLMVRMSMFSDNKTEHMWSN